MADIDQIIAGGSGASSRADFSALADIPEAYWKGKDRRFTQDGRDLFKGGVPTNPDGSINYGAMRNALFQHGDIPQGTALDNLDLARQKLAFGQKIGERVWPTDQPGSSSPAAAEQPAPVLPPSINRQAPTPVGPPLSRGGAAPQDNPGTSPPPGRSVNLLQVLDAQGIPNDQLGAAGASLGRQLGVDPTQPIDITDPRVRNVLVPAIQQLKRGGIGQVSQDGQGAPAPQGGASASIQPMPVQTQAITPQAAPSPASAQPGAPASQAPTDPTLGGLVPRGRTPEQQLTLLRRAVSTGMLEPGQLKLYEEQIKSLEQRLAPTENERNFDAARRNPSLDPYIAQTEAQKAADKTFAEKSAESYVKKYDAITKAGAESATELPKLGLAKTIMASPDFYTGPVEGLNLAYKRILATIDPSQANAAQPQEAFRKIISDSVRSQIRSLAESGVGRISIPEVRIIEKAAANQENTPAANRLLVELSTRMHQQTLGLDELARNYNGGRLNAGFDTAARKWVQDHPIVTPAELKDPRVIAPPVFATPDAVRTAGLPKGSPFQTPDGRTKYVP